MKIPFHILLACFLLSGTVQGQVRITVSNPCGFDRSSELVELSLPEIKKKILLPERQTYLVRNAAGAIIPSQTTYDGRLVFQSGLKAGESAVFTVAGGIPQEYAPKVYGALYPARKDDFVWENDRVGFRFYGHALKYSDGPSNGLDLWYKRTEALVLQKWYEEALNKGIWFHHDRGEGCDPYAVGRSLGAGAMAPYISGKPLLNENFLKAEILDSGPLRFTARLEYPGLEIGGRAVPESRVVSIDAGSRLTMITEDYGRTDFPVAAGVVSRLSHDSLISKPESGYFIYAEPETVENGSLFIGVCMPSGIDSVSTASYSVVNPVNGKESVFTHTLAIGRYRSEPLPYYTGFGWSKSGFPTIASFEKYMDEFVKRKKRPFKIRYK